MELALLLPTEEEEVGEVRRSEAAEEELEVDRRAREMFASVVRPQFGSTSRARLLIWVVMLCLRELFAQS